MVGEAAASELTALFSRDAKATVIVGGWRRVLWIVQACATRWWPWLHSTVTVAIRVLPVA